MKENKWELKPRISVGPRWLYVSIGILHKHGEDWKLRFHLQTGNWRAVLIIGRLYSRREIPLIGPYDNTREEK